MADTINVTKWVVATAGDKTWGRKLGRDAAERRVIELSTRRGAPYRLRYRSEKRWGPKVIGVGNLRGKVNTRMDDLKFGDVLWVDNDKGPTSVVRARKILTKEDPLDLSNCTESCEVIIAYLRREFPNHFSLGWFNCRRIAGSSSWSQHAWGNAYDAGGPFVLLKAIAAHLVASGHNGSLPIAQVIFNRQSWTPTSGMQFYGGSDPHTAHVHVTARPELNGTPPCA